MKEPNINLTNPVKEHQTPDALRNNSELLDVELDIPNPANEEDVRDYIQLRLEAISNPEDAEMLGFSEKEQNEQRKRSREQWKEDLNPERGFVILAWNKSKPIAMGRAILTTAPGEWVMGPDYVKPEFRKLGIGKALSAQRVDEIRRAGGKKIYAYIKANNPGSLAIAKSLGFEKNPESSSEGEVHMVLNLNT